MIETGRRAHAESRFGNFTYDEEKLRERLAALISLQETCGSHLCLVAESREGRLIGMLIGMLEEYFFTSCKSANTAFVWVDPAFRGSATIRAFCVWGEKKGAIEVSIPVASDVRLGRTDRFLRRLGFAQTGGNYSAPLRRT